MRTGLTPSTFSGVGTAGSGAESSPKVWRFVADFVSEWAFSGRHELAISFNDRLWCSISRNFVGIPDNPMTEGPVQVP